MAFGRNRREQGPSDDTVKLTDPGREPTNPRQLLHGFLTDAGLSVVLYGPLTAEDLLRRVANAAPILRQSSQVGGCFSSLDADPNTLWTAMQGSAGAAVGVFLAPDSDSLLVMKEIIQRFEALPDPLLHGFVTLGSAQPAFAALVADAEVVPAWEVDEFRHVPSQPGYTTYPASIRRAAMSWQRGPADSYRREFVDTDGETVTVSLVFDGYPMLLEQFAEAPSDDLSHLASLVDDGPYQLQWWDPGVMFTRQVHAGVTATDLVKMAQSLCDDLAEGLARLREERSAGSPALASSITSRSFTMPDHGLAYTVTERVRESVPDGMSTFDSINEMAAELRGARKSGFEYALRGSDDELLSPTWLTVVAAAMDGPTGRFVVGGHLTHEVWDLPPAYDLGAIDGRNWATFPQQGHGGGLKWPRTQLYVGSVPAGTAYPLTASTDVISVDLHGPSGTVGVLEFLGSSSSAVAVYPSGGPRRLLTVVEDIAGNEPLHFSGNGEWLLLPTSNHSTLIEVASGRWTRIDVGNTTWWPITPSTLLTVANENGQSVPRLFNLTSNAYEAPAFPALTPGFAMLPAFPYFWSPVVSPDGTTMLVVTPSGVSPEYQREHGAGNHLVEVNLASGRTSLVHQPFLDSAEQLERDVRDARWTGRLPHVDVRLHPQLEGSLNRPVVSHQYLSPSRWSDDIEQPLVLTLNKAIGLTKSGADPSLLMPEVLTYLSCLAKSGAAWERQSAWLVGLRETLSDLISRGEIKGPPATTWMNFADSIEAIQAGQSDQLEGRNPWTAEPVPHLAPLRAPAEATSTPSPRAERQAVVSLNKGANVALGKIDPDVTELMIGLGWDPRGTSDAPFDLDASAFAVNASGKVPTDSHFVFFNNLQSPDGAIIHQGDNITGAGDGDDEQIKILLAAVAPHIQRIVFLVSIYDAVARRQNFGEVRNAFIRVVNSLTGQEIARYDLTEDAATETAMVYGEIYRHSGEWKFRAIGQGYASGFAGAAIDFGVNIE